MTLWICQSDIDRKNPYPRVRYSPPLPNDPDRENWSMILTDRDLVARSAREALELADSLLTIVNSVTNHHRRAMRVPRMSLEDLSDAEMRAVDSVKEIKRRLGEAG
jgi:hypothetical protein